MISTKHGQPNAANMNLDWFKILIIDDEPANVEILEEMLHDSGYQQVISYTNPVVALADFHQHQPDLVLLDLRMPQMNGLDVLRKLGEDNELEHSDVMVLTADTSRESKLTAFQQGAIDFISKPFDIKEIQARIDNLIESRFQVKRLVRKNKTLDLIVQARAKTLQRQQNHLNRLNKNLEQCVEKHSSELNNVHYKLQQSNIALSNLISAVSHQFKTPLTSIKGYAELLRDDFENISQAERTRFLSAIADETSRLDGLVSNLLDLQNLNTENNPWQSVPLNMIEVVKQCIELIMPSYEEKNINLRSNFTDKSTTIAGDEDKLTQVLLNLLSNALTYTDDGDVVVSVDTTEHWAELVLFSNNASTIDCYEKISEELEITLHTFRDIEHLQTHLQIFGRKTAILILDINPQQRAYINNIEQICFPLPKLSVAVIDPETDSGADITSYFQHNTQWLQAPSTINAITLTQLMHGATNVSINFPMVRIQIADTGTGIPGNQLNDIFSQFHQVTNSERSGIGVGLTISKEIIERHNGRIWAESEWGRGSKFTILLPVSNQ